MIRRNGPQLSSPALGRPFVSSFLWALSVQSQRPLCHRGGCPCRPQAFSPLTQARGPWSWALSSCGLALRLLLWDITSPDTLQRSRREEGLTQHLTV